MQLLDRRLFLGCAVCAGLVRPASADPARRRARGIVDVHAHIQVASYLALLETAGVRRPVVQQAGGSAPLTQQLSGDDEASLAARIAMMDAAGVRTQVLSPTLAPYVEREDAAVGAARLLNNAHAQLVKRHPGRLASFVSLPLPHLQASLAELRRGLDELGMAGVSMQTSCLGTSIADDRFEPLFAELNRRSAVLAFHPAVNGLLSPLVTNWGLTGAAGPLLEDAVLAMHLMVKGIPYRYPNIRMIIPHLGGGLATMVDRLDNQLKLSATLPEQPSVTVKRFWYDTVAHGSAISLQAAVRAFGADRLLPGSDFPVLLSFESYGKTFDYVRRSGLKTSDADRILHDNAERLFGP